MMCSMEPGFISSTLDWDAYLQTPQGPQGAEQTEWKIPAWIWIAGALALMLALRGEEEQR
jgi:uncharacterized membrane protein YdcZ (DUF606 family)